MPHPVVYQGDMGKLLATRGGEYVGRDEECVALPQGVTKVGHTSRWQPGARVVDLKFLLPGTVIANFWFEYDKHWFPNTRGYHAALFLEFGNRNMATGGYTHFWVLDQWKGKPLKKRNKNAFTYEEMKRNLFNPCDNANDYYVVMVP